MSPLLIKVLAGLALIAAVMVGLHLYDVHQQELGAAQFKAQAAEQALTATQENLRESNRRAAAINQKAINADQAASAARVDADAVSTANQRLRQRIATLNRDATDHSAPAVPGASNSTADVVSADLFTGVVDTAGRYAAIADAARIAGQACEQSYDALTIRMP